MPPPELGLNLEQLSADAALMGCHLTPLQGAKLVDYAHLLLSWNQTYNLTAIRDPAGVYMQHVLDCLAVVPSLVRETGSKTVRLLDVGTGAGLPGLIVAIACPHIEVVCVDAVGKKVAFVRQAIAELGLPNAATSHSRVETISAKPFDVICSRALGSLSDFSRSTGPLRKTTGVWMAMKGATPTAEIAALPSSIEVFHVEPLTIPRQPAARCLVWMR